MTLRSRKSRLAKTSPSLPSYGGQAKLARIPTGSGQVCHAKSFFGIDAATPPSAGGSDAHSLARNQKMALRLSQFNSDQNQANAKNYKNYDCWFREEVIG